MPPRELVVIGASAGGITALTELVKGLGPSPSAAFVVAIHLSPAAPSALAVILARASGMDARNPEAGEAIMPGRLYAAAPDTHVIVRDRRLWPSHAPRENGHRPAIDPLFRSAADSYGDRVVGVLLSGSGGDGAEGLYHLKARGGVALVQDPAEALHPEMPRNAIAITDVDGILRIEELSARIHELTAGASSSSPPPSAPDVPTAQEILQRAERPTAGGGRSNDASLFTCPECGGVLWELDQEGSVRFRCHVGHAYSLNGLLSNHSEVTEGSLWAAVRMLQERAMLSRRHATRLRERNLLAVAETFEERSRESERAAEALNQLLEQVPAHGEGGVIAGAR